MPLLTFHENKFRAVTEFGITENSRYQVSLTFSQCHVKNRTINVKYFTGGILKGILEVQYKKLKINEGRKKNSKQLVPIISQDKIQLFINW